MRQVLIDQGYLNRDLRSVDGTNAYALRCDFRSAKFGNITNASFVDCDLRGADFSGSTWVGATFTRCQYAGIILPSIEDMVALSKVPAFDHVFMAMLFLKFSETNMVLILKDALRQMARDLIENPGLSYRDFVLMWCERWTPNVAYIRKMKEALTSHPRLRAAWRQYAYPIVREYFEVEGE